MNQQPTSEATCTFRADTDLLDSFGKAIEIRDGGLNKSQVLRKLVIEYIEEARNLPAYERFFAKKVAIGQAQSRNGELLTHSEVLDRAEARRRQLRGL